MPNETDLLLAADAADDTPLLEKNQQKSEHPPVRMAILVVMPIFMGYAALFSLQKRVLHYFTFDDKSSYFATFEFGVSWLYIGNLIMRLGHNIVLAWLRPRWRVVLSMLSMFTSMVTLGLVTILNNYSSLQPSSMWIVFVCYFLGGFGIGSFEANLLNVLVPLGHATKRWAIYGMPVGVLCVTVGGFMILQALNDVVWPLYLGVAFFIICSFIVYEAYILRDPVVREGLGHANDGETVQVEGRKTMNTFSDFVSDLKMWRVWLPVIGWHVAFMALNMFSVSVEMPLGEYCFPQSVIVMSPGALISHDMFIVVYSTCFALGDTISRKLFYPDEKRKPFGPFFRVIHPSLFVVFGSAVGVVLILLRVPMLAPVGSLLMALANGGIYAQTVYRVDQRIDHTYNLTSLSVWLFLGDCGAVIGTNLIKALIKA